MTRTELMKDRADPAVELWYLVNEEDTVLPAIALAELSYGIARLADGVRRRNLDTRLTEWRLRYAARACVRAYGGDAIWAHVGRRRCQRTNDVAARRADRRDGAR